MDEIRRYDDYQAAGYETARRTCLHVATVLGDLLKTDLTVVGGLVPSLLVPQDRLPAGAEAHCGTLDVDLALALALLNTELYADVSARLRAAGFSVGEKEEGKMTRQTWRTPHGLPEATIDFLIPRSQPGDKAGGIRNLEKDFAAIIMTGLEVVARDSQLIVVKGRTLLDEQAEREIRVCGPGAFVALKARALHNRGKEKDAYDLVYVLQYFDGGVEQVAEALKPLLDDIDVRDAIAWLAEDFAALDSLGPMRAARFRYGDADDALRADAWGLVQELLRSIG